MALLVVGLSHKTTPVEVRERVAIAAADLPDALAALRAVAGVREAALLSTCNRTEVYAEVEDAARESARLGGYLADLAKAPLSDLAAYLYSQADAAAVRHVFRVAASLDSMVIGESQILGQVKAAFAAARAAELARGRLTRLLEAAFSAAKKVRSETRVGAAAVSVSGAAVDLATTIFGELRGRSVLLIGAGETGRLALEHLRGAGVQEVFVANRTPERAAAALAEMQVAGHALGLDRLAACIDQVDIVVSSIQADGYVLDRAQVAPAVRRRRGRPLFLVDISVPRSLDPALHQLEATFLYDIDDLQGVVAGNQRARHAEAQRAERLIEVEVLHFLQSAHELDVVPAVKALLERFESIRRGELERHLGRETELSPQARAAVDAATRAMLGRIAHGPIRELKRAVGSPEGVSTIAALTRALCEDGERERKPGGSREGAA